MADTPKTTSAFTRVRNYFLTGLIIAAPVGITIYLTWSIVQWIDGWVKPFIPSAYNPESYLPFTVPGLGLLFGVVFITILGFLTANLIGKSLISFGENMVARMPIVRTIYSSLKQIFETVLSDTSKSFQEAGLIEYPRPGLWALVFVATETKGEVKTKLQAAHHDDYVNVFIPTTPNPTSGFLLFVPRSDVKILDMTIEEAAKLVVSGGLVTPTHMAEKGALDSKVAQAMERRQRKDAAE